MSTRVLTQLTVAYLEAPAGEMLDRQHDLEGYLRRAGNSEEQLKYWMTICLEMDGDEDGDLQSEVTNDAMLSVLQGDIVISQRV
jgi:hypothetical protein